MRKAELKEIGRQEALNRGKRLDENGRFKTLPISAEDTDVAEKPQ